MPKPKKCAGIEEADFLNFFLKTVMKVFSEMLFLTLKNTLISI